MKKFFGIFLLSAAILPASGQRVLTLDSCRQMALRNNKHPHQVPAPRECYRYLRAH